MPEQTQVQVKKWIADSVDVKEKIPEAPRAVRRCPKCNSPYFARVNTEAYFDKDGNILIYCANCKDPWIAYDTEEVELRWVEVK